MTSFLEHLTDDLLAKHNGDLSKLCLIFPTRRAGLYFKKTYSSKLSKPAWAPVIYAIEDFIQSLSKLQVADQLDLIFELYEVYRNYFPSETFDRFYPWGIILLNDFNDADSSMANAHQLFSSISDIREIEEQFDLAEEDKKRLNEFWKVFFDKEPGEIRKNFIDSWKHLGNIYSDFKERLVKNNSAYAGLVARSVADSLLNDEPLIANSAEHYVFAGFNALTKAEETIIQFFIKTGNGSAYFDSDNYYVDDLKQEAGSFIRKSKLQNSGWKESVLESDEKNIEVIGVPLQSLQAKIAGQILEVLTKSEGRMTNGTPAPASLLKTAIVLPDEQLLIPVLYSLPSAINDLNVTMGYPLHNSPLFKLIESLFELQKSFSVSGESFYFKNVLSVLSHPYLQNLFYEDINGWMASYRTTLLVRIPKKELLKNESALFGVLFSSLNYNSIPEWFNYLNAFFKFLIDAVRKNKNKIHSMEREYVYYFFTRFKKLQDIIQKFNNDISVDAFRRLYREVIYSTRIPFTGEPLKGLQIMGFLETRVLDFETVIILSLNEDVLPASLHRPSFIPFNIRKAFRLPTFEEQNAIASYHFYRLLQRAKNIYLIYNTEVKSVQGGEKSRFILQIENELLKRNPKIKYSSRTANIPLKEHAVNAITIEKTEEVLEELQSYFSYLSPTVDKSFTPAESSAFYPASLKYAKKLSASGLGQYISCPLKFYFRYIARLKDQDEAEETIEGGLFGTILHEAMDRLYKTFQVITEKDFVNISKQVERVADEAIKLHFTESKVLEGKNILMRNVLVELLRQIVSYDREHAPLSIKHLEKEFTLHSEVNGGDEKVLLYGIIDRVDIQNGTLRVVDYKTGRHDSKEAKNIMELFSSPDYKEQFQTFFYSWLLHKKEQGVPVLAGLFRLKAFSGGMSYLNKGEVITTEQFSEFEQSLKKLLQDIFDPKIPFAQTQDVERCTFCSYKNICNR